MSKINVPFALLSLVTSVLLWASVYNEKNDKPTQKTVTANLSTNNFKASQYVITKIPEMVDLPLSGYTKDFRRVSQQVPSAIVDLAKPILGEHDYQVIVFPAGIRELLDRNDIKARIKIEALVTKRVEVKVNKTGNLPNGNQEDSLETSLRWIYVRGPADFVQKVSAVQLTLNLSELKRSPHEEDLDARPVDANGRTVPKVLMSEFDDQQEYRDDAINNLRVRVTLKFGPIALPENQNPPKQ